MDTAATDSKHVRTLLGVLSRTDSFLFFFLAERLIRQSDITPFAPLNATRSSPKRRAFSLHLAIFCARLLLRLLVATSIGDLVVTRPKKTPAPHGDKTYVPPCSRFPSLVTERAAPHRAVCSGSFRDLTPPPSLSILLPLRHHLAGVARLDRVVVFSKSLKPSSPIRDFLVKTIYASLISPFPDFSLRRNHSPRNRPRL